MARPEISVTVGCEFSPYFLLQLQVLEAWMKSSTPLERLIERLALDALIDLERMGREARFELGLAADVEATGGYYLRLAR